MWCSWRTVSAPSGASRYQPLIGAEQATSLAGGLDCSLPFPFLRCHVFVIIAFVEPQSRPAIMHDNGQADDLMKM